MHPAYFETRVRTPVPVRDWPDEFVIISAYATTGEKWSAEQNEAADQRLEALLRTRGCWLTRVVGYASRTGHAEPSWAAEVPVDQAREIGRQFQQDAIFLIRGDFLYVTKCVQQADAVPVAKFISLLDQA